jgi:hypothetical protein
MSELAVEVTHLFISSGHNYFGRHGKGSENHVITACEEIELVAGRGVINDRFFDYEEDYKGQLTLFDHATYERVKERFELPDLEPSAFRRNVVIKGVDLNGLIGARFQIGDIELTGSQEAKPCYWMDEACAPGVDEFLRGYGGLRCRITVGGKLSKGEKTLKRL